ncbi:MAG: DedA family protein, partial [Planctomycetota bacterium]
QYFFLLVLSGVGLPFPEELTLLIAGFLPSQHVVHISPMFIFCATAVFISDMIPYSIGYLYGERIFGLSYVQYLISPKRVRKVTRFFRMHGYRKAFLLRPLLLGIRPFIMLVAGISRMKLSSFVLYQITGEIIGVVVWLSLGNVLARHLEFLATIFYIFREIFFISFIIIAGAFIYNKYFLKKKIKSSVILKISSIVLSILIAIILGWEIIVYREKIKRKIIGDEISIESNALFDILKYSNKIKGK